MRFHTNVKIVCFISVILNLNSTLTRLHGSGGAGRTESQCRTGQGSKKTEAEDSDLLPLQMATYTRIISLLFPGLF